MKNNYGIYFQRNNTVIRIPANPEEFIIENPTDNKRYDVLDLGEIVVARIPMLKAISWEGYLPGDRNDPFALGTFRNPEFYIKFFEECQNDLTQPVRFIVNRIHENNSKIYDTNITVRVEKFDIIEKGGETGDFRYTIQLTQFRNSTPRTVVIQIPPVPAAPPVAIPTPQREVPSNVLNVGDEVIVNGNYWYSSWASRPTFVANNLRTRITRIVQNPGRGQTHPIHVGVFGWVKRDQVRKV